MESSKTSFFLIRSSYLISRTKLTLSEPLGLRFVTQSADRIDKWTKQNLQPQPQLELFCSASRNLLKESPLKVGFSFKKGIQHAV